MHLVFLTAYQDAPFGPAMDHIPNVAQLKAAILSALQTAVISANVAVRFEAGELTATIKAADADATFAVLEPVFCASPFCRNGFVLLRYGAPGAPERQVSLAERTDNEAPTA